MPAVKSQNFIHKQDLPETRSLSKEEIGDLLVGQVTPIENVHDPAHGNILTLGGMLFEV